MKRARMVRAIRKFWLVVSIPLVPLSWFVAYTKEVTYVPGNLTCAYPIRDAFCTGDSKRGYTCTPISSRYLPLLATPFESKVDTPVPETVR